MTNYEKLFQEQMRDLEFAKAYRETRLERMLNDFLENLKEKITKDEPKENLINTINLMQRQLDSMQI